MKNLEFPKKDKSTGFVNPSFEEKLKNILYQIYQNRVHLSYKDLDELSKYTYLKEYHIGDISK